MKSRNHRTLVTALGAFCVFAAALASACAKGSDSGLDDGDAGVPNADAGAWTGDGSSSGSDSGADAAGDAGADGSACVKVDPSHSCGIAPQCGCAPGYTCELDDQNKTQCVKAGLLAMGHGCTSTQDCGPGLACVFGACRPFCNNPGQSCSMAGTSICYQVSGQSGPIPNFAVCFVDCNLVDPQSCGGANDAGVAGCTHDRMGHTDCEVAGTSTTTCSGTPAPPLCTPGSVCISSGGSLECARWCRVGQMDCTVGVCTSHATPVIIGVQEYGTCQ